LFETKASLHSIKAVHDLFEASQSQPEASLHPGRAIHVFTNSSLQTLKFDLNLLAVDLIFCDQVNFSPEQMILEGRLYCRRPALFRSGKIQSCTGSV
jgi:hypothetical protein